MRMAVLGVSTSSLLTLNRRSLDLAFGFHDQIDAFTALGFRVGWVEEDANFARYVVDLHIEYLIEVFIMDVQENPITPVLIGRDLAKWRAVLDQEPNGHVGRGATILVTYFTPDRISMIGQMRGKRRLRGE
jgi:hypothetical protein